MVEVLEQVQAGGGVAAHHVEHRVEVGALVPRQAVRQRAERSPRSTSPRRRRGRGSSEVALGAADDLRAEAEDEAREMEMMKSRTVSHSPKATR